MSSTTIYRGCAPVNRIRTKNKHGCKSQDSVGEIGTVIWVGKRSENTDFRQGTARRIILISPTESWDLQRIPTAYPSIRLDTDELCHLEMPATFHKINARSSSLIPGRIVVTNKKLRFLSVTGGTEIGWNSVMRVQVQSGGIYLELSRKTGNGFTACQTLFFWKRSLIH